MPPALTTQTTIAFIWDFDKTLIPGYMQDPLFAAYDVSAGDFWAEVNGLAEYYAARGLLVSRDTAYLSHILTYVREGHFGGLTNARLRELGARIEFAPGIPDFFARTREFVGSNERYKRHGVEVEHYIVSTGLRQMIEGSGVREHVDGIWACEFLSDPPGRGYLEADLPAADGVIAQIGYAIDNTTKTRAVFEINKGVNKSPSLDVNARMGLDDRRVPFRNMVYIADGPSDVPVFSVIAANGGKTLGVYSGGKGGNFAGVRKLQDDGRVNHIAEANYSEGSAADLWLLSSLEQIADEICDARELRLAEITPPAGHKVE